MRMEQHALWVFERRMPRRILIAEEEEMKRGSRKLNSDGF
jgi:hypothetical protein